MCGRGTQYFTWQELHELYDIYSEPLNLEARYNVPPTTDIVTVRDAAGGRVASKMRWGLIPSWWKQDKPPASTINARAEGITSKPMWRGPFKSKRCVIPFSGFYEWLREGKAKRPFYITMADDGIMSLAGLWDVWEHEGEEIHSCAIVTTGANKLMAGIHDRMPAILGKFDLEPWLSGRAGEDALKPCPDSWIKATEVSTYVNSVRNQGEACIEPVS